MIVVVVNLEWGCNKLSRFFIFLFEDGVGWEWLNCTSGGVDCGKMGSNFMWSHMGSSQGLALLLLLYSIPCKFPCFD